MAAVGDEGPADRRQSEFFHIAPEWVTKKTIDGHGVGKRHHEERVGRTDPGVDLGRSSFEDTLTSRKEGN